MTAEVVVEASASSFKGGLSRRHAPEKAFDGRANTAWNESGPGPGVGDWIEARLSRSVRISHITITPGWDGRSEQGEDLFTANRYATAIDVQYDGGQCSFRIPEGTRVFRADLGGVSTSRFRITATEVQPGTARWDDWSVSQIHVFEVADAQTPPPVASPAGRKLDVMRPLAIVRPTREGTGSVMEEALDTAAADYDLPACSGSDPPCAPDPHSVRFRLGTSCRHDEGRPGIWIGDPISTMAACVPRSYFCGVGGITHDPEDEFEQVAADGFLCAHCPAPTRFLQHGAGHWCRGFTEGWRWECSSDGSALFCMPPSLRTGVRHEAPSPERPFTAVAGSYDQRNPSSRAQAERQAVRLVDAGFGGARVLDGRVYPSFGCCHWIVLTGATATRAEAARIVNELRAAGIQAYAKRAY